MNTTGELVTNTPYKAFIENYSGIQKTTFPMPNINDVANIKLSKLSDLGLLLKKTDANPNANYGIEIKVTAGSRDSRIPVLRCSQKCDAIFKVSPEIKSIEKTAEALNDLIYHIKADVSLSQFTPKKVIVLNEDEVLYSDTNSQFYNFIAKIIENYDIYIISFEYIKHKLKTNNLIDFDAILSSQNIRIFTSRIL